ncbi:unnamed protein product [Rhizoctonia solani]|uniref:Uncharacterized protein n=1 Tax=Rhizoctonia solani TaxID=456999 RepID=A0A8H3BWQ2_9AGAM|nr:unnamed protein product [Rhizoctonia solani]
MGELHQGSDSLGSVGLGKLAEAIALAADALASAAEALADAARTISDASSIINEKHSSKDFIGGKESTHTSEERDSGSDLKIDQKALTEHHARSESKQAAPTTSPSAPSTAVVSEFSKDTKRTSLYTFTGKQAPDLRLPQCKNKVEIPEPHLKPERQSEIKIVSDASELPPKSTIRNNKMPPKLSLDDDPERNLSSREASYRNYIHLDQDSDALAFIAYMIVKANRVICIAPEDIIDAHSEKLQFLTLANIYHAYVPQQFKRIAERLYTLSDMASHNIVLTPANKFILNAGSFKQLSPDCILHWGPPTSAYHYRSRVLSSLAPEARACIILVGQIEFNGVAHGVEPYSNDVLNTYFCLNSPLQLLRQKASISHYVSGSPALKSCSKPARMELANSAPPPFIAPVDQPTGGSLPAGHYYIVLDSANDKDTVPVIAYLVSRNSMTVCYVPEDKELYRYRRLIDLIINTNTLMPTSTKGKKLKPATNWPKSEKSSVLLRPATKDWFSFWSKSLEDCIVYWGIPSDLAASVQYDGAVLVSGSY